MDHFHPPWPHVLHFTAKGDPGHGPNGYPKHGWFRCISSLLMLPTAEPPPCFPFPPGCGHRTLGSLLIPASSGAWDLLSQLSSPHPQRGTFPFSSPHPSVSWRTPKREQKEPVPLGCASCSCWRRAPSQGEGEASPVSCWDRPWEALDTGMSHPSRVLGCRRWLWDHFPAGGEGISPSLGTVTTLLGR